MSIVHMYVYLLVATSNITVDATMQFSHPAPSPHPNLLSLHYPFSLIHHRSSITRHPHFIHHLSTFDFFVRTLYLYNLIILIKFHLDHNTLCSCQLWCHGLVDRASASYAIGTWSEYAQARCDQSLNNWYRLIPLARRSA